MDAIIKLCETDAPEIAKSFESTFFSNPNPFSNKDVDP
jgi:hypothetical protein